MTRLLGRLVLVLVLPLLVTSQRWRSSYAVVRAYRKDASGAWHLRYGPWSARVGWHGMVRAADRRQDSGTTPAGTFRLLYGFGSAADPGSGLTYRRFDKNDWWVYDPRDPRTYNVWEPFRSGQRVATDTADTRRGGGIFLHVRGSGATAGCVAVARDRMRTLLRWLSSDQRPRIVVGPVGAIDRM